ncbi:uncharacterized protein TrAtP1_001455 [Trichoderma atroviride]|uniref:uncharacterized protein n=1 Tax=Hypocrea atroviridis TaxID=63577 RepID=UPI00332EF6CF|nr:hypothetical protein TrAtP1_001455 [Trichoderma atroviride]
MLRTAASRCTAHSANAFVLEHDGVRSDWLQGNHGRPSCRHRATAPGADLLARCTIDPKLSPATADGMGHKPSQLEVPRLIPRLSNLSTLLSMGSIT